MNNQTTKIINALALIFMIVMNGLAVGLPLGGVTTGELSDLYPNLFVPAGFTFAIWSVIYLLLISFVAYEWVVDAEKSQLSDVSFYFALNGFFNGLWIVVWHYQVVPLSLVVMLGLLWTLIMLHRRLGISYFGAAGIRWFTAMPISVYLGWISVATIANFTTVLVHYGYSGVPVGEDNWAAIMLIVAVLLGVTMLYRHKDIFFAAVIAWASYGILSKRIADTTSVDGMTQHISEVSMYVMIIGILLTITIGIVGISKPRKSK